jgi:hypothetical protein
MAEPTPTEGTEARAAHLHVVQATTVSVWANAERGDRGQSSALTCRIRHLSRSLSPRRWSEQRPEQRPQLSCSLHQYLAGPKPTNRNVESDRGQRGSLTCRDRQHSGWLSKRRPCEHRPAQRPHQSCSPNQWLARTIPTRRSEARFANSPVVHFTTVAVCSLADQPNRGHSCALTCCARNLIGWLSQCRPSEQRPEQCPHLTCPPPQWLAEPTLTDRTEAKAAPSPMVPANTAAV